MIGIKATITHFVPDDDYPDWVRIRLVDAHGREWTILEKVPVVTGEDLNENSDYPRPVVLACEEISRRMCDGRDVVLIDLDPGWGLQATDGTTRFEVYSDQLCPSPC
jgi:hypothetical protein